MRIYRAFVQLGLVIALFSSATAQTTKIEPVTEERQVNQSLKAGDLLFQKGQYYNAIPYFKKAYAKEKDRMAKSSILFKIGESYRNIADFKNAEDYLQKSVAAGYDGPLALLYLAEAQKALGKYTEALANFKSYHQIVPDDARGNSGIASCEVAKEWVEKPTKYVVENVEALNTRFQDFNLTFSKRNPRLAIFTSARQESTGKEDDGWTGQKYTDLFQSIRDDKGKWSTPQPLPAPINSEISEGSATFDKAGTTLFFTRCPPAKSKNVNCNIYYVRKKGEGWDNPKQLPILGDTATIGHPALSPDEKALFFSSTLPGGYGGKDLYVSVFNTATRSWTKPINLGPKVNTEGDEMYPTITVDGTLYFASSGHVGMGGLDIFKAKFIGTRTVSNFVNYPSGMSSSIDPEAGPGESPIIDIEAPVKPAVDTTKNVQVVDSLTFYAQQWDKPENLKYPINSSYDDFAIVFEESINETGYFSSNREGGKGSDDIYRFRLPPLEFTIQGKVMDIDNRGGVKGASIELLGNDGSIVTVKTDKRGVYIFDRTMVKPNTVYKLTASAKDYLSAKGIQSTVGLTESTDLFQDAFLLKSTLRPITIPNIFYDLAKANLRPESKTVLDSVVFILNDNPKLVVRIMSHTDSRSSDEYNMELSQKRAQSVVDYLVSKGIDPERLVAQGYGESKPKITDAEIAKLKTEAQKEAAHQSNRRTEFEKIRDDYVPKQKFGTSYKDSSGQNIRVSKPMLSSKDSAFFNLKDEYKKTTDKPKDNKVNQQKDQQQPAQQPNNQQDQTAPENKAPERTTEPSRRDSTQEPKAEPTPER